MKEEKDNIEKDNMEKDNMEKGKKEKKRKNIILYIVIVLLLILIAILIIGREPELTRLQKDLNALEGILPGKTAEEIQRLLNEFVEEGMVNIAINPEPEFENGRSNGNINIENIPGNHYALQVDIVLNDTGETVFQSGLIDPGFYLQNIKLSKKLSKGDYPATAIFTAYYIDEVDEVLTKANVDITLHILN